MLFQLSEPAPALSYRALKVPIVSARAAAAVLLSLVLFGCVAVSPRNANPEVEPSAPPDSESSAPTTASSMSEDTLYKILLAEFAGRRGQVEIALDSYLEVAEATRDPAVAERAVRIAVFSRDHERGLRASKLWTEIDPTNLDARRVYGALLMRAGRLDDAVEELAVIVSSPNDNETRFTLIGDMLAREKDKAAAAQVMDRIVLRHPNNTDATFAQVQLLGRTGDFERALTLLDDILETSSDHERAVIYKARILQR
ncbi:MAG TPA: hypothetical protein VIT83_01845, partial [Gammaproteobacteria bacterium]